MNSSDYWLWELSEKCRNHNLLVPWITLLLVSLNVCSEAKTRIQWWTRKKHHILGMLAKSIGILNQKTGTGLIEILTE